ncbi:alpha-E domain-containing protein [Pedobacter sp. SYSU D00535]|uniref:alpha-E domain-containing protein n=1 Tax=Pedobacter sp. SYSU D00535 TaxID=2810308 RepID=UPI001A95D303|nr:alpha-E domain-containing protein [Pedobacter sp. SYSU D00535]
MLSRVAANLYWLSRYMERSDGVLRMLKINYASSQDALTEFSWASVINIYSNISEDRLKQIEYKGRQVLDYMLFQKDNPCSILSLISMARENARSVQDHITNDLWQCLNEYYLLMRDPALIRSLKKDDPISVLDLLIKQIMLYYGTAEVTMARGESRSFMSIGKYLERSIQSADLLHVKFGSLDHNPDLLTNASYWKHLLQSLGGYELYLKTFRQGFEVENILDQVVLNVDFPRSVIYSINNISKHFEKLKSDHYINDNRELSFMIGRLQSRIKYSSVSSISAEGLGFLSSVKNELYQIGNAFHKNYFSHA